MNCGNNQLEYDQAVSMSQAMDLTNEARVICLNEYPYPVIYANKAWTLITGYHQHEVSGKSLQFLQGEQTNRDTLKNMMNSVVSTGFGCAQCINYTKEGKPIFLSIIIQPILSSNIFGDVQCSHYLGRILQIPMPNYFLSNPLPPSMPLSISQSPLPLHVPSLLPPLQDFTSVQSIGTNSPVTTSMYYNISEQDSYFQSFQLV